MQLGPMSVVADRSSTLVTLSMSKGDGSRLDGITGLRPGPQAAQQGADTRVTVLQQEQNDGLSMLKTLPDAQRRKAILTLSKTSNNNLTEAFKDNLVLDYAGLRTADLDTAARKRLVDLVELYVGNMDDGHARVKMDEVRRHLDNTWFAWIGGIDPASVFYYRIHSPVILIEFDHQLPANLRHLAKDPRVPNHEHIHVVVRTPNGNDYGKDLLKGLKDGLGDKASKMIVAEATRKRSIASGGRTSDVGRSFK